MTTPIRIDVVSDVMCPWCIIGFLNLQRALEALDDKIIANIHWQPFELNPNAPAEGEDMQAHLQQKYGISAEESQANRAMITERGAASGFEFDFIEGMRMSNTFNAHQLLHWAGQSNPSQQTALKLALFKAHFQDHQNLHEIGTLAAIAESVGFDANEAHAILTEQRFALDVRAKEQEWQQAGVRSVPAFIFQQKYLVSGGQPPEAFVEMLTQLIKEEQ